MKPEFVMTKNLRFVPKDPEAMRNYITLLNENLNSTNDLAEQAHLLGEMGVYLRSIDQLQEAEQVLEKALAIIRSNNLGLQKEIQNKIRLAHVYQEEKLFDKSNALFQEIIHVCRNDKSVESFLHFALQHAGKNEFDQGNLLQAEFFFKEALNIRLTSKAPQDQIESTEAALARVHEILSDQKSVTEKYKVQIEKTKKYLTSDEGLQSLERDPYWPKWNSPWWHMLLLHEMGLAHEISKIALNKMVELLKSHYLPIFPVLDSEIPENTDPYRKIACHCAVGSMYQVLFSAGIQVDKELPWMRPWMLHYQLPDGGLNCDEKAYTKINPKSSIVTTINCLEAIFFSRNKDLTDKEITFLEKGFQYLLRQKLFRKISTGEVIDANWLEIKFPRFYEYDFFRGYYFIAKWANYTHQQLPNDLVNEVKLLVGKQISAEGIILKKFNLVDNRSYNPSHDNSWHWGQASEFELYKAVSQDGNPCSPLTEKWNEVKL